MKVIFNSGGVLLRVTFGVTGVLREKKKQAAPDGATNLL